MQNTLNIHTGGRACRNGEAGQAKAWRIVSTCLFVSFLTKKKESTKIKVIIGLMLLTTLHTFAYNRGVLGFKLDPTKEQELFSMYLLKHQYDSKGAEGLYNFLNNFEYTPWVQPKPEETLSGARIGKFAEEEQTVVKNTNFVLYPNPTNGVLNYNVLVDDLQDVTLTVYDVLGHKILNTTIINNTGSIDLNNVNNGIYFVTIANTTQILFNTKINVLK